MQSSIVKLLAILSTGVWAAPLNPISSRATCNINSCVVALAPSFLTACDPASAQLGANTPFNTACLAAAAKGTTAFMSPAACTPCAAPFGVTDPVNKASAQTNGGATENGATAGAPTPQGANTNGATLEGAAGNTRPAHRGTPAPGDAPGGAPAPGSAPVPGGAPVRGSAPPAAPKKAKGAKAPAPARPRASTCDIQACVVALGPSFPLYTSFNHDCLIAAAKGTGPFPTGCGGCATQFGVTEPSPNTNTNSQDAGAAGIAIN
ncbi:hypothetical protein C8J57DRAFT_1234071 [Mycena rebaudengoi]|nr:hypothetical protein C8J57DRAFT_1234071 [Mycena rebaudengoi]